METYALFDDASATSVVFDFFAPDPKDDPVRLTFPDIEDVQVRNSARNGCQAAYQILSDRSIVEPGDRFFPSCQFADASTNVNARGDSAGLAFCLKFAREVYRAKTGRTIPGSVAATGILSDGTREARVEGVRGINEKLEAALGVLGSWDLLLYPADNESDIRDDLREAANRNEVQLAGVTSVTEAIERLMPIEVPGRRVPGHRMVAAAAIAVILIGGGWYAWSQRVVSENTDGIAPSAALEQQLEIEFSFQFRTSDGIKSVAVPNPSTGSPEPVLRSGDLYRIGMTASDSAYVYVYQIDATGALSRLGDSPEAAAPPPIPPIQQRHFPSDPSRWFSLDQNTGSEILHFIGSRSRIQELERAYEQYRQSSGAERAGLLDQVLHHIEAARLKSIGNANILYASLGVDHR